MKIRIIETEGAGLYKRYTSQSQRQPCFVELDCVRGELTADYNPEIGNAFPTRVYHGHVRRYSIPALTAKACNVLFAETAPLAQRVINGYDSRWDGHNHVANLNADATAADEEIARLCETAGDENDELVVWNAADWFASIASNDVRIAAALGITADSTDDDLDTIETRELAIAHDEQGVHAINNIDRYLKRLRLACVDAREVAL